MFRQFEHQVGIPLFRRHNGKISTTPEADILFAETERVYAGVKSGVSIIDQLTLEWFGNDRIIARPFTPDVSFKVWLLQLRTTRQPRLVTAFREILLEQLPIILKGLNSDFSINYPPL